MDIVFPEDTGQLPRVAKRPLQFTHVLALVYCFAGVSGVLAILSKFVTTPLFEELTYERSQFANEARLRLIDLNALLAHTVSKVPSTESIKRGYVNAVVEAGERGSQPHKSDSAERSEQMQESLRSLRFLVKSTDPNDGILRQTSLLVNQAEELTRYARSLQYEAMPGTFVPAPMSNVDKSSDAASLGEAIISCRNEIRKFKGSILSS